MDPGSMDDRAEESPVPGTLHDPLGDSDANPGSSRDPLEDAHPGSSHDPGPGILSGDARGGDPTLLRARVLDDAPSCAQKTLLGPFEFPAAEERDLLNPWEGDVPPIEFRHANLALAASYVVSYFRTRETHDWLHVMVKAVVFDRFARAVEEDPLVRTLAFSCWCDGGKYPVAEYRQHRHCIVVAPKDRFQTAVAPQIQMTQRERRYCRETFSCRKFPCRKWKRVEGALHLVNLIGYVSNRKSSCRFDFETKRTRAREHHFYLYRTLPRMCKLPLVLLWDGGVYELLRQERFQNVSLPQVVKRGVEWVDREWRQRIKHFYELPTGWVTSVSRRLVPANLETDRYLCLMRNKRLYFREVPEPLDEGAWLLKQVEGGHCFYDAVGNEWWTPRPRDKKILNFHMPVVNALETRVNRLEEEVRDLRTRSEEDMQRVREENKRLHEEIKTLHERWVETLAAQLKAKEELYAAQLKAKEELYAAQLKAKEEEINRLKMEQGFPF